MNLKYVLFGNMCSGKTSVGQILRHEYGYPVISAKDLVADNLETADDSVKNLRKQGYLLPDDLIIQWVFNGIDSNTKNSDAIILDGFPRTAVQAEELVKAYGGNIKVIYLDFDIEIIRERFNNRILCTGCQMPYSESFTDFDGKCHYCGSSSFNPRLTDRPDYFKIKTSQFESSSLKVIPVFENLNYKMLGVSNHRSFKDLRDEALDL